MIKYYFSLVVVLFSLGFYNSYNTIVNFLPYVSTNENHVEATNRIALDEMYAFVLDVESEDESCTGGGGMVTLNISETEVDAILTFSFFLGSTSGVPVSTEDEVSDGDTFVKVVQGLPVGSYTVRVTENVNGTLSTLEQTFSIGSNLETFDFLLDQERRCDGIAIVADVTAGIADYYELYLDGTSTILDTSTEGDFPALTQGVVYEVRGYDNCGTVRVRTQTIDLKEFSTDLFTRGVVVGAPDDCSTASYNILGNSNFGSNGVYALPIEWSVEFENPTDPGNTTTVSGTMPTATNFTFDGPYYPQEEWDFTITAIDACGTEFTHTYTKSAICGNCSLDFRTVNGNCGGQYLWFRGAIDIVSTDRSFALLEFPDAFDPTAYGFTFDTNYNAYTIVYTDYSGDYFGGPDDTLPEGDYVAKVYGGCGNETSTVTRTIEPQGKEIVSYVSYGCEVGEAGIRLHANVPNAQFDYALVYPIESAVITSAPAAYTGPTNLLIGDTFVYSNANVNYAAIDNLIPGTYTFEVVSCGETITHEKTIESTKINEADTDITRRCGSFDVTIDWTSNISNGIIFFQYFNETSQQWGKPDGSSSSSNEYASYDLIGGNGNNDRGNSLSNVSFTINSLNLSGKYRFFTKSRIHSDDPTSTQNLYYDCFDVIEEFEFYDRPQINDYYVFQCIDGTTTAVIDAEGVEPLNYQAISFNGNPISIDNGTSPVFSGLDSGLYTFLMTDSCGNQFQFIANTSAEKLPRIRANNLCEGSAGSLFISGLDFMDISWTKGADPTVIGTGNILPLDPFDSTTDVGEYHATISYSGDNVNCADAVLDYNLTAENTTNAEAGTGQTVTIVKSESVIDLFNYITGPYDDFGYWEETTATSSDGLIFDSEKWDITNVGAGTYTFLYTVEGGCSGEDTTTVTITLIDCQSPILTIGDLACNASGTSFDISFISNATTITNSEGTLDQAAGTITNIPPNTVLTIEAYNSASCAVTQTITTPATCPTDCILPDLQVGQAVCDGIGATTYTVSYSDATGATISVVGGTDNEDGTITANIGTDIEITATNGACVSIIDVTSPENCDNPCGGSPISIGGTVCNEDGLGGYTVPYVLISDATITISAPTDATDDGAGLITVPNGGYLTFTISLDECTVDRTITVQAPVCEEVCQSPVLTLGDLTCNAAGDGFEVSVITSLTDAANITVSAGDLDTQNRKIINIPFGTTLTVEARNGISCTTEASIVIPSSCPTGCIQPDLNVGQAICDGTGSSTYSVAYSLTTAADISISVGDLDETNMRIINIPVGVNLQVSAVNPTDSACTTVITVNSPTDCDNPCENPGVSLGSPNCATDLLSYSVNYIAPTGVTITTNVGVVDAATGMVTDIPIGTDLFVTASYEGCANDQTALVVAPSECRENCQDPVLTIGNLTCNGTSYSVDYISDGENITITPNVGNLNTATNKIENIPFGSDITITAQNGNSCITTASIEIPDACPTDCIQPDLTVGQAFCDGVGAETYTASYVEKTGATITVDGGVDNGDGTLSGTAGNDIIVTATNGSCETVITIPYPDDCSDPCINPNISIGGTICSTDLTEYSVSFTAASGVSVTADQGNVDLVNGIITNIPIANSVVITATFSGCTAPKEVTVTPPICEETCQDPILTVGELTCDGTTYSLDFISDGATISASSGVVDTANGVITGIAFGSTLTITASNGTSCETITTVAIPSDCPSDCVLPDLTAGQGICDGIGSGTYTVNFTETTGATLTVTGGTNNGDGTITGTIGTDIDITATNGSCESMITITSPTDCDNPCDSASISIGGTECSEDLTSYSVLFTAVPGVTVTADQGTVDQASGTITGIPTGTNVIITTSFAGCTEDRAVTVASPTCEEACQDPLLTVGELICDGSTYSLDFISDGATIEASSGIVDEANGVITNITLGSTLTITATNGTSCETITTVAIPSDCPSDCVFPDLTVGQGICDGVGATTYTVNFTETTGATLAITGGTNNGDGTITGTIGTDIDITATNGSCESMITITSPTDCDNPCDSASISIGGTECSEDLTSYSVLFTAVPGVTVTADQGTVDQASGTITGIPTGTNVIITTSFAGCTEDRVVTVTSPECEETCQTPLLTVGELICDGSTYSLDFISDGATINASSGVVDIANGMITGIAFGSTLTITASNGTSCETITTVAIPSDCPSDCVFPDLTVGQGICDGVGASTYTVNFTETTGATLTVTGGTNNGDGTITGAIGTDIEITATNGNCESIITITSPTDCDNPCENPSISIGGTECSEDLTTYSVLFAAVPGVTVTADQGTVDQASGTITGIPTGTNVIITTSFAGCTEDRVVTVTSPECEETCQTPLLTVGELICDGSTYSLDFISDGATINASSGVVDIANGMITGIVFGSTLTITASNGTSCETITTVAIPSDCPSDCVFPDLTVGQGICDGVGTSTYTVNFTETTGATLTVAGGTNNGDGTITGTIGTDIEITATNGSCESIITITSPTDCDNPCDSASISIGGTECSEDLTTYSVLFTVAPGVTIMANQGTVNLASGTITGIPTGTNVIITTSFAGCTEDRVVTVTSPECEETCQTPLLTVGELICDGSTYSLDFISDGATINASSGVVDIANGMITGIAFGSTLTITASNGTSCETITTVAIPSDCPSDCVFPDLTVGQGICDGVGASTYTVNFTETTGATLTVAGGTNNGDGTITGTIGTDIEITATNGSCESIITITSPTDCDNPCDSASISIGGTECSEDLTSYSVLFTAVPGVTVTADQGTVDQASGTITGIPTGTNVIITTSYTGCTEDRVVTVTSPECEETCQTPLLTVGELICDGSTYSLDFISDGATINASSGVVDTANGMITGIAFGSTLTITASNGTSCETITTVAIPSDCPSDCVFPDLTVGQGICDGVGATTYTVNFTETTGATLTIAGGTNNGDGTITGTIGTDIEITATNGSCESIITITSPTDCDNPCDSASISIGGTDCSEDLTTYSVLFAAVPGVTVTADQGTVNLASGTITGIPTGTNVIITTSYIGCTEDRVVTVTAPLCLSSSIAILKDGVYEDSNNDGIVNIGDTVLYTFEVSNTGETDLTNITVTDPKVTVVGGPINLAAGETDATSFTASYMITQADIDAGGTYNLATVTGTDPGGDPITETSTDPTPVDPSDPTAPAVDPACPDCTITVIPKETGIAIFKDGIYEDSNNDGIVNIGDTVLYTFEVSNTGETDLTNITVTDPKVTVVGGPIDLAAGETDATSFTASYMITQADIDAGGAYNLATVTGTDPGGDPITETSTDPTPVDPSDPTAPAVDPTCPDCTITDFPDEVSPPPPSDATDIAITKEISKLSAVLNEEIVFTVTVTNLGTIEATNIEVSDKLPSGYRFVGATSDFGSNYNEITGILSINSLAPGESVTLLMRVAVLNINDYMNTARLEFLDQEDLDDTNNEASAGSGVVLSNCFEIFNEMTPNNDGKNDYFKIQCIENYPGNTVDIYNRYGIKVYSAKDYQNNWDGTSDGRATIDKGAKLPTGTYYYVIDLNEGDKPLVGWLYIN